MSRGRSTFKQRDLTRALRAAQRAGLAVQRVRVMPTGEVVLEFGSEGATVPGKTLVGWEDA